MLERIRILLSQRKVTGAMFFNLEPTLSNNKASTLAVCVYVVAQLVFWLALLLIVLWGTGFQIVQYLTFWQAIAIALAAVTTEIAAYWLFHRSHCKNGGGIVTKPGSNAKPFYGDEDGA